MNISPNRYSITYISINISNIATNIEACILLMGILWWLHKHTYICVHHMHQTRSLLINSVNREYYTRVRKIWQRLIHTQKTTLSHYAYARPLLNPLFGILGCSVMKIEIIYMKTGKILRSTGYIHWKNTTSILYLWTNEWGTHMRIMQSPFEYSMIPLETAPSSTC